MRVAVGSAGKIEALGLFPVLSPGCVLYTLLLQLSSIVGEVYNNENQ